ncbi:ABC transporter permease [Flaviaesturariibacter flavus]|uniref:ABC transporter permease n=1 Tax=Flaviaesturariibacter flavus TaxID=2502780 RepID=A0A4R1BC20_9BACT|nr:ABC transporter permease [Flaviaesturariibacter flavus]TCJ14576.1 ABC transporter permease [Flaviaesturariibacter flavus]
MNKIAIIIKREYLTRVRKKSFILSTLLTPLVFVLLIGTTTFFTMKNVRNEKVAVVDPNSVLKKGLESGKMVTYGFEPGADTGNYVKKGYTALLLAPRVGINNTDHFKVISENSLSRFANDRIENDITRTMENNMISEQLKVDPARIDSIKKVAEKVTVDQVKREDIGQANQGSFNVQSGIGYITAFLIYIMLFVYGMMVMRGVMEEKTNRIAEVIVSSVRPFELMLGKIVGIGAVGLTQFLMWIVLLTVIGTVMTGMVSPEVAEGMQQGGGMPMSGQNREAMEAMRAITAHMATINWGVVISCFLFYFLGGYLFYAALFAAVGSAVNEDPQDVQSLTIPITMPIIVGIIIMVNSINDPSSPLATWASLIPFTSPIVMMSRIPFGVGSTVPYWQLGLSMLLLIGGFLLTTWFAGRIYRTGILLYGKKPTWKEMVKWIRK